MKHCCKPPLRVRREFLALARLGALFIVVASGVVTGLAQSSGQIKGVVRLASGAPAPGVAIIVTNQVTGKWKRTRSGVDGRYSFSLLPGAYRLKVGPPQVAKFDKDKNYGDFTIARGDVLENVIIEAGKETLVDIPLDQVEIKEIPRSPGDKPTGNAGAETVNSEPQTNQDRREARDRWRIGFPEYDRYGDRAARGRDIPFKRGRWWDPYNQSVLKGDYPIRGNDLFMILSAVSTTTVEQRRAPTPSDVSSDEPVSGEFLDSRNSLLPARRCSSVLSYSAATLLLSHATGPSRSRQPSASQTI
ncbi:MAG: carboxypeptidase-like regulatory domain-containing protein [bacterium]